jgi:hypothetical protein
MTAAHRKDDFNSFDLVFPADLLFHQARRSRAR